MSQTYHICRLSKTQTHRHMHPPPLIELLRLFLDAGPNFQIQHTNRTLATHAHHTHGAHTHRRRTYARYQAVRLRLLLLLLLLFLLLMLLLLLLLFGVLCACCCSQTHSVTACAPLSVLVVVMNVVVVVVVLIPIRPPPALRFGPTGRKTGSNTPLSKRRNRWTDGQLS